MKLLAIDNNFSVLRNIEYTLKKFKWYITTCGDLEQARDEILHQDFDIIVCDYLFSQRMGSQTGIDLIKEIKKKGVKSGIILMTARNLDEVTPWEALNSGADDFLKKPYRPEEMVARIKAVARRRFSQGQEIQNIIRVGDVSIDLNIRKVYVNGEECYLGHTLFLMLQRLLEELDKLITYEEIVRYIWGEQNPQKDRDHKKSLRVHMVHLKKKLGEDISAHLQTIYNKGYVWQT